MERERFGSRLGFILVSAGCAIGLGNVWRFPYITGEYGGAAFVVLYLIFLVIFALPVLVMEFAAGRASQRSIARSYDELEPEGGKWHRFKWVGLAGNYLLMMFYTVVAGWMLAFMVKSAMGEFNGASTEHVASVFGQLLADPVQMTIYMLIIVAIGVITTRAGLKNGVERVTKVMMVALFVVLVALCVRAVTLPGAEEGIEFYLMPDFGKLFAGNTPAEQWATFGDAVYAALGQAFFTVSVGMGSTARTVASQARPCAWACSTRWLRSWRGSSSSRRASPSAWSRLRGRRLCSSRCPSCSTRCPWGSCGARCSSCS